MYRFVLQQNIARLRLRLETETDAARRAQMARLLIDDERQLARIDAGMLGLGPEFGLRRWLDEMAPLPAVGTVRVRTALESNATACLLLDPRPGLRIVDLNPGYAAATLIERDAVVGQKMFDVFPDNPDDPAADGVRKLYRSLRHAAETGVPQVMAVQRYDVRDAAGRFVERWWRPCNTPVFDPSGRLAYLLHDAADVTPAVHRARIAGPAAVAPEPMRAAASPAAV